MLILFNIVDEFNKLLENFKNFMKDNMGDPFSKPIFWVGAFCLGIALFSFTYNALQKEK